LNNTANIDGPVFQKPIRRVAVIGGGPTALSWAKYYFARGFDVAATDPTQKSAGNSRQVVDSLLSTVLDREQSGATRGTLKVTPDLDEALLRADFIQECDTGTASSKVDLLVNIDKCTRPDSVIASDASSSSMNIAQSILHFGERCIIARSLDLPHLSPFTVILNSAGTSSSAIRHAMKFYSCSGRVPIYLRGQVSDNFTYGLLSLFRKEAARLRELDVMSERDLHDFGSWAPSLCCSALIGAIQAGNTSAFERADKRFHARDSPIAVSKGSASPACVP